MSNDTPDQVRSVITARDLDPIRAYFQLPDNVVLRAPGEDGRVTTAPAGYVSVYLFQLEYGCFQPFLPFASELLGALRLAPAQLCPRAWRILLAAEKGWEVRRYPRLSLTEFLNCYRISEGKGSLKGWVQFVARSSCPKLVVDRDPREKGWKERFLWVSESYADCSLPWNRHLFLSHLPLSNLTSRQRERLIAAAHQPFRFVRPRPRYQLRRRTANRFRREDVPQDSSRFWDEEELEYPSEAVLLWLFDRSSGRDPIQAAIDHGLISRDEHGKVRILRPHWEGICEKWQRLQDEGPSTPSPEHEEFFDRSQCSEEVVPLAVEPETDRPRLHFRIKEGVHQRMASTPRPVPAPLQRVPPMLGPIIYGAALQDYRGLPTTSSANIWDRSLQVAGEIVQDVSQSADQWGVDDFFDTQVHGTGRVLPPVMNPYVRLSCELDEVTAAEKREREAQSELRAQLAENHRLLRSAVERCESSRTRAGELDAELVELSSRREALLRRSPGDSAAIFNKLIQKARTRLAGVLGKKRATDLFSSCQ